MADSSAESPLSPPPSHKQPCQAPLSRGNSASVLLNKYEQGKLLGRGSFAKVYAARAIATKELVAIKVIDKNFGAETIMETRIIAEVSAMKKVESHPNILKIQEVMASKTKIYLVMDLAVRGELYTKVLQRGRLKEALARRYFHQLVSALHFCHQNGVAHRDVKPQNLLLDQNGDIKLSDFGLSSLSESSKEIPLRTACGTPAFSAPEVFGRRGYDGRKADTWSCGVVLFFFLTGCLPFDDTNIANMYKRIQRREYQVPGYVSRPARGLIVSLLDPNPRTRMTLEDVMAHSWFSFKCSQLGKVDSSVSLVDMEDNIRINPRGANAFEIISTSSWLDLSRLFIGEDREKRFTSELPVVKVMGKVKQTGGEMGFRVEERSAGAIGWENGAVSLLFQALQIADRMLLVEIKLLAVGDWGNHSWLQLKKALDDVVLQWNN